MLGPRTRARANSLNRNANRMVSHTTVIQNRAHADVDVKAAAYDTGNQPALQSTNNHVPEQIGTVSRGRKHGGSISH